MPRFATSVRFEKIIAIVERRPHRVLGFVLVAFLAVNILWQDVAMLGHFHDDTLYFSSAKALAQGRGYVIPSLPGAPYQTKYPVLYPWLLSWIWKLDPEFPRNVRLAYLLTSLFGAGFTAGCYVLARSMGHRVVVALTIAVACALHPLTQFLSASVLSDMPFMAFAVWAMALGARWLDETEVCRRRRLLLAVVLLVSLAILTRSIAVTLVAGILMPALLRRAWRESAILLLISGAVTALSAGWSYLHRLHPEVLASATPGYRQTLLFYTDYLAFWRESVPDSGLLPVMILRNSAAGLLETGLLAFGELLRVRGAPLTLLPITLSIFVVWAAFRLRGAPYQPVHFIFIFYCLAVALWNYPLAWRFLVLFLPFCFVGAYRILAGLGGVLLRSARSESGPERIFGYGYLAVLAAVILFIAYSHLWYSPHVFAAVRRNRAEHVSKRLGAYSWIASRTAPADRVVSYEDVLLYLYTERQGIRPVQLSTATSYDSESYPIQDELEKMGQTAEAISASFWLVSEGDWWAEEAALVDKLKSAVSETVKQCPVAADFGAAGVTIRQMSAGRCMAAGP